MFFPQRYSNYFLSFKNMPRKPHDISSTMFRCHFSSLSNPMPKPGTTNWILLPRTQSLLPALIALLDRTNTAIIQSSNEILRSYFSCMTGWTLNGAVRGWIQIGKSSLRWLPPLLNLINCLQTSLVYKRVPVYHANNKARANTGRTCLKIGGKELGKLHEEMGFEEGKKVV